MFGEGTGDIFSSNVVCSGSENNINECSFVRAVTCEHSNDVGVLCYGMKKYQIYDNRHSIKQY